MYLCGHVSIFKVSILKDSEKKSCNDCNRT